MPDGRETRSGKDQPDRPHHAGQPLLDTRETGGDCVELREKPHANVMKDYFFVFPEQEDSTAVRIS